jgi:hypothetical protein
MANLAGGWAASVGRQRQQKNEFSSRFLNLVNDLGLTQAKF